MEVLGAATAGKDGGRGFGAEEGGEGVGVGGGRGGALDGGFGGLGGFALRWFGVPVAVVVAVLVSVSAVSSGVLGARRMVAVWGS